MTHTNELHMPGLLGSYLPVIIYVFEVSSTLRWEMTIAPDPNPEGNHEQRVMFRFLRVEHGVVTKTVYMTKQTPPIHCVFR